MIAETGDAATIDDVNDSVLIDDSGSPPNDTAAEFDSARLDGGGNDVGDASTDTAVQDSSSTAVLSADLLPPMPTINLNVTDEGTLDWVHWGLVAGTREQRREAGGLISPMTVLTTQAVDFGNYGASFSWTNGLAPTTSASSVTSGLYVQNNDSGFAFEAAARADSVRTLQIYFATHFADCFATFTLTDGSKPTVVANCPVLSNTQALTIRVLAVRYRAAALNARLTVALQRTTTPQSTLSLLAATLR